MVVFLEAASGISAVELFFPRPALDVVSIDGISCFCNAIMAVSFQLGMAVLAMLSPFDRDPHVRELKACKQIEMAWQPFFYRVHSATLIRIFLKL